MSSASGGRRLAELLAPVVAGSGLDLEAVEIAAAGRRRQVRVLVDKDGGVSLDDVALVSRSISQVLDEVPEADALLGSSPYVLEVSSPGVGRPLTEPRHWRRADGRLVTVTLKAGGEVTGRVAAAAADGVQLETGDAGARELRYDEIATGRVEVEFARPGAPEAAADAGTGADLDEEESP